MTAWQPDPPDFEKDGVRIFEPKYYWAIWDEAFPEPQVVEVMSDGEESTSYSITWDCIRYSPYPEHWFSWWPIPLDPPPLTR